MYIFNIDEYDSKVYKEVSPLEPISIYLRGRILIVFAIVLVYLLIDATIWLPSSLIVLAVIYYIKSSRGRMLKALNARCIDKVGDVYIKYNRIISASRVERNKNLLEAMILHVESQGGVVTPLQDLRSKLYATQEGSDDWYRYIARIEYLYDNMEV